MAVPYKNLYYTTDELISRFKPSLSNYFDVYINSSFGGVSNDDINFLAYEAVIPGTSLETTQVFGDRQGLTQTYANKRVYPPVDVSFYVDFDYKVLEYFEQWISSICPNLGVRGDSYQKFNYPRANNTGYKKQVIITKFEKDFKSPSDRLISGGTINEPNQTIYTLLEAYPTNLISLPVSYEGANLLRTTVTFNYDVYHYENKVLGARTVYGADGLASNSSAQPGTDSASTRASSASKRGGEAIIEGILNTPVPPQYEFKVPPGKLGSEVGRGGVRLPGEPGPNRGLG